VKGAVNQQVEIRLNWPEISASAAPNQLNRHTFLFLLSATPNTTMSFPSHLLSRFADVRNNAPGSSSPGAYHVLLSTLFNSNFTVSPQWLTVSDRASGLTSCMLMFEVRLRGKLVFVMGVKPPADLRLPLIREPADNHIRDHIKNLAGLLRSLDLQFSHIDHIRS
jgi:hypothetical protein